jgi:hypothetical protein
MPMIDHVELSDDERALYTSPPVSDRASKILTWGLGIVFGGVLVFMVLAATVLRSEELPGVSYGELTGQPIYVHQPPQSTDVSIDRGSAASGPDDSAHRYVVRKYVTRVTPEQTRDYYLRQFGQSYSIDDTHRWDTATDWILRGSLVMSDHSTADPPTLSVRVAIGREMVEERTRATVSIESDY